MIIDAQSAGALLKAAALMPLLANLTSSKQMQSLQKVVRLCC